MEQVKLNQIMEQHKLWLNRQGGKRAKLNNEDLTGLDLSNRDLRTASIVNCNLSKTNFDDSNLLGTDLSGSDLTGASFKHTLFIGTNLNNIICKFARFLDTKFINCGIPNYDLLKLIK